MTPAQTRGPPHLGAGALGIFATPFGSSKINVAIPSSPSSPLLPVLRRLQSKRCAQCDGILSVLLGTVIPQANRDLHLR